MTDGIDITQFQKNPVMLFNHIDFGYTSGNYQGPIGRWENIRKEDGKLLADAVFDLNDPNAKMIADKVENDFIRAASLGFMIIATDESKESMSPGQTRATVTKCKAVEASIVDFPGNENALCLYDENSKKIDLKDNSNFQKVNLSLINHKTNVPMKLKLLSTLTFLAAFFNLKFEEKETEKEFEFTQEKLKDLNTELETLSKTKADLQAANQTIESLRKEATDKDTQLKAAQDAQKLSEDKYKDLKATIDGQGSNPVKPETDKLGGKKDSWVDPNAEHNRLRDQVQKSN